MLASRGRPASPAGNSVKRSARQSHHCSFNVSLHAADAMTHVKMYTTQVCPFCIRAKALLKQRGVEQIEEIRIDLDASQRDHMMAVTGRRTVPQIFIGDTHVGGCDDLMALDQKGALLPLLHGPS
jgi:glutaredoxin 3